MGFRLELLVLGLFLVTRFVSIRADIFSCMVKINASVSLIRANRIAAYLDGYIQQQKQVKYVIQTIHQEFIELKDFFDKSDGNVEDPLQAFGYAWHAQIELNSTEMAFLAELKGGAATFDRYKVLNRTMYFPSLVDLHGSGDGILAIQEVHKLKASDIADGNLAGYKSRGLTFFERLAIAQTAPGARLWVNNEDEYSAIKTIEWLEVALDVAEDAQDASTIGRHLLVAYKNLSCVCSTHYIKNINRLQRLDSNITLHENCTSRMPFPCAPLYMEKVKLRGQENFEALCRGEEAVPLYTPGRRTPDRLLKCRLSHYNDPRLLIDPVKEEELNLVNPRISILHDILTEKHVNFFKRIASPFLRRGPVTTKDGAKRSYHKISQQFVLPNTTNHTVTENLVGRLSAVSRLQLQGDSFEDIMVVNYGTGGVYGLHIDGLRTSFHENQTRADNNRLATIVTYLNDVKFGGETVFPDLGIKVKPERRAAVMFFNLYKNGDTNELSRHSSCPIVYGEKWIANQWIRKQGQEFNYLCSEDRYE